MGHQTIHEHDKETEVSWGLNQTINRIQLLLLDQFCEGYLFVYWWACLGPVATETRSDQMCLHHSNHLTKKDPDILLGEIMYHNITKFKQNDVVLLLGDGSRTFCSLGIFFFFFLLPQIDSDSLLFIFPILFSLPVKLIQIWLLIPSSQNQWLNFHFKEMDHIEKIRLHWGNNSHYCYSN